ncbi:MAG: chromosome segregation protein SMC [Desulfobacterales bacterium]|nr:chromosome segregation protein SMC [Desulfobacterales bacterium]
MKLKKLEITGFKSFLEKSSILFPPGISAVVGPNGCGKSNIVDALRWVMGEQSVRQLRGKSMEDIIFAGTNDKPPMNMAEVSLTLANDNGSAPEELKDFTEIMLTRRLYRSGESVYLLNKQPCRLKDIHNVFLGSGMGAKAYSVIQQGSIGAITDSNPDEKRLFIEEAAGITRYKTRKVETLRKINATNQNLLRVTDILTEIKRQMAGLKRQAGKANTYKVLQEKIRHIDLRLSVRYDNDYACRIEQTDTLLKSLKDTDLQHTSELKKLDAAVEEIKLNRWEKNQEISAQKSRKYESQRHIDKLETELHHLKKDLVRLSEEIGEIQASQKNFEEKNKKMLSEINQIEQDSDILSVEKNDLGSHLAREQAASQGIRNELSILTSEIEKNKTELMSLVAQEARYKNTYQNASSQKDTLFRRIQKLGEEKKMTHQKVNAITRKKTSVEKQLEEVQSAMEDLELRLEDMRGKLGRKSESLAEFIKQSQTLELERNGIKSKYAALKKMESNFDWYKDGVKSILKRQSQGADHGQSDAEKGRILGLMADVLEPEASYEIAVEAALGESLQYILVKDQDAGLDYIEYLQQTRTGRSGFIPLSAVRPPKSHSANPIDSTRRLLNHVGVKPGFEPVIEALLGDVIVAADRREALKIWNRNGVEQAIVTKDGDMIFKQGIMVGGNKDDLSSILLKKQEIKELNHQITRIDERIKALNQDKQILESEVLSLENNLQKMLGEMKKTEQNKYEAEKELYKVTEDLKHASRHLDIVTLEEEQLMGDQSDIDDEMAKYNQALSGISAAVKKSQERISRTSERINALSSEMENFSQKIIDLKLNLTSVNAKLENNQNSLRRLREFQVAGVSQAKLLSNEIVYKNQKMTDTKQKITEHDRTLVDFYDDIKQLERQIEKNEAEYHAIDFQVKDNDSLKSNIQSDREKILEKVRILEVEQSQWVIKRENLFSRVEERYGASLETLKAEIDPARDSPSEIMDLPTEEMEDRLTQYRKKAEAIGDVNLGAIKEYEQLEERFDFLSKQQDDLSKAIDNLYSVIKKINRVSKEKFLATFDAINEKLTEIFPRLFEGGSAKLILTEPQNPLETGVDLMIQPFGKKLTRMSLLSGGEKALAAIAFIFSIFLIKPSSFCLMDEIDAPLDDANVYRFNELLKIIGEKSQIVVITHNKKSMEFADTLFGITMEKKGVSKIVSVNL